MSCDNERSCPGRSLAIGAIVLSSYKEIFRYIKISSM